MGDERERLCNCFRAVFPTLSDRELAAASVNSVEEWDSLATVNLMAVIQEEFGIDVRPEDFKHFTSFAALLKLVQRS